MHTKHEGVLIILEEELNMETLERIKKEIEFYKVKITDYKNGNVDPNIKGIRSAMGVYAEREVEKYMTRMKTPAGIITLEQFEAVSKIADKYSHGRIHFTTRQDIQFHGVELEDTVKIMNEILEFGINTLGAGGNSARNVACSPLSGVDKDEIFDVTPYAVKTADHLLKDPSTVKLPRKYKVSFSNNNLDTAYATIADLGFVAKIENGKKGFEVYAAGGLGGASTTSLKIDDFIEEKDALYYVQAMKELFEAEGDRENRNKARIRFIRYRLGDDKFKELLKDYVNKAKKNLDLDLNIKASDREYENEASKASTDSFIIKEQKQEGYYSVFIHTSDRYIETKDLNKILNYLKALDYETTIRLTNTQGFYVRDIKGKDVDKFFEIVDSFTTKLPVENTISCVGAKVCGIGLCNSQGLSNAIYERFLKVPEEVKKVLPKIFISGCNNSCGQHQIGKIAFSGKAIRGEEGMIPAYSLYYGGTLEVYQTKFGEVKGEIPAKNIPEFLYELAFLAYENKYENFDKFIEEKWSEVEVLIEKFRTTGIDSNAYYDFNSDVKFLSKK